MNEREYDQKKLPFNLKRLRQEKGLTMADVMRGSIINYKTLVTIERGVHINPRTNTLIRLANYLNVSIDELLT